MSENLADLHVLPSTWMDSSSLSKGQPLQVHNGLQMKRNIMFLFGEIETKITIEFFLALKLLRFPVLGDGDL